MGYSIKNVAEKVNLSAHALRYYEKEGLLPNVNRTQSGNRLYSDEDLEWLGLILCLKNTGMSIRQIRDFVNLSAQGPGTLKARCEMLVAHKREVEERIAEMNRHLQKVSHKIAYYTRQYEEHRADDDGDHRHERTRF